jgi:hypothetical protein
MTKQTLWTAVLAAAAIAGCADGDGNGTSGAPGDNRLSCTATISPSTFSYMLDSTGATLQVNAGQGNTGTLNRVGAPSSTIYGAWTAPDTVQSGITLHLELHFDPNPDEASAVVSCSGLGKTAMAVASSPATITASSVTILQADSDVEYSD